MSYNKIKSLLMSLAIITVAIINPGPTSADLIDQAMNDPHPAVTSPNGPQLSGAQAQAYLRNSGLATKVTTTTLSQNIAQFIKVALSFIGVLFLALIVYAGFLWLTSAGEEGPVKKAKEIIKAAVIGLLLVFLAYAITAFVLNLVYPTDPTLIFSF